MKAFRDRADAGRQLAHKLVHYRGSLDAIVLALPRGGVPVGAEIARKLKLPLDVLVVRKLGTPDQPELAIGAIASGGIVVINSEVQAHFALQSELVETIVQREREELSRRERAYRSDRPLPQMQGRTAIVVDDGAATGASLRAAAQALRTLLVRQIVVAVPVAAKPAARMIAVEVDEVVCLGTPGNFYAVGQWYENFEQTTDEEVRELLSQSRCSVTPLSHASQ